MDIEKIWNELQSLNSLIVKINKRDKESIAILNKLYLSLFGESVTAGCSNCHIKAFTKLTSLTYQNLIDMSERKYKLKKGITIEFPSRGGRFYNDATMTDDLAKDILVNHPEFEKHFSELPPKEIKYIEEVKEDELIVDKPAKKSNAKSKKNS